MSEVILQASSQEDLEFKLAQLDINVPLRSKGRQTYHVERYCIAHLLATLPVKYFSFPMELIHSDRPDFLLVMPNVEIGVEHTEAVPRNIAKADFIREKEKLGPELYPMPRAFPGEPKKTADELRREINENRQCSGWIGDSPERQWAEAIAYYVRKKIKKAMEQDFSRYQVNWLIVYDNWPLPPIDHVKAASYLEPILFEMDAASAFDAIFVQNESCICEFGSKKKVHSLKKPSHIVGG